ncbi:MAG: 50S ribosomal protein L19 [Armatimonadetes bacterium]|nr:50S ribosomal protein L19 [Armatimonadota bacterium]
MDDLIAHVEKQFIRGDIPAFGVGDLVRVHFRVVEKTEKGEERSRVQAFEGRVIRRRGSGTGETFTVRRVTHGVGVERTFPLHSPLIERIEVLSRPGVRRARLYYLRERVGKKARLRQRVRRPADKKRAQPASAEPAGQPDETATADAEE